MKSFEQIAKAMRQAFLNEGERDGNSSEGYAPWDELDSSQKARWVAAAQEAARQLAEVY